MSVTIESSNVGAAKPSALNEAQIELLNIFSSGVSEQELAELKQLLLDFKFRRVTLMADEIWAEKGWTDKDAQKMAKAHERTPYRSYRSRKNLD